MKVARPSVPGIQLGALRREAGRVQIFDGLHRRDSVAVSVTVVAPDDDHLEAFVATQEEVQGLGPGGPVGLPRILATGQFQGSAYVVTDAVGPSLNGATVAAAGAGPLAILNAVAVTVSRLHAAGLGHGCLEPDRIVATDGGWVLTGAGVVAYEPAGSSFRSPQLRGPRAITVADDVFSLGVLGRWLFDAAGVAPTPEQAAALSRATAEVEADRQWSVEEFLYEVTAADTEPAPPPPPTALGAAAGVVELPPADLGAGRWRLVVGAFALAAVGTAAAFALRPSGTTEVMGTEVTPSSTSSTLAVSTTAPPDVRPVETAAPSSPPPMAEDDPDADGAVAVTTTGGPTTTVPTTTTSTTTTTTSTTTTTTVTTVVTPPTVVPPPQVTSGTGSAPSTTTTTAPTTTSTTAPTTTSTTSTVPPSTTSSTSVTVSIPPIETPVIPEISIPSLPLPLD